MRGTVSATSWPSRLIRRVPHSGSIARTADRQSGSDTTGARRLRGRGAGPQTAGWQVKIVYANVLLYAVNEDDLNTSSQDAGSTAALGQRDRRILLDRAGRIPSTDDQGGSLPSPASVGRSTGIGPALDRAATERDRRGYAAAPRCPGWSARGSRHRREPHQRCPSRRSRLGARRHRRHLRLRLCSVSWGTSGGAGVAGPTPRPCGDLRGARPRRSSRCPRPG
jgi:hypothetical protein